MHTRREDRRLDDGMFRAVEAKKVAQPVNLYDIALHSHPLLGIVKGRDAEFVGAARVVENKAAHGRGGMSGHRANMANRRTSQQQSIVGHVQHTFGMSAQVLIRLRRWEGPQQEAVHLRFDARAHGRQVHRPVGRQRRDEPFEDHDGSSARRSPAALCNVSSYSRSGSESATMPPPTGNCSQPPAAVKVRMRMLVSIAPSKPIQPRLPQYGPRACGSSSAMISIARTFGAPVTEPPGNAAFSKSIAVRPLRSCPRTSETR